MGFSSILGAIAMGFGALIMPGIVAEIDAEAACENDIDPEECEAVIGELISLGESNIWSLGAASSALLFILSIPTAILMWNAPENGDRDTALKFAGGWIAIHAISQFYVTHVMMSWSNRFYGGMESDEVDLGFISLFNQIASYGGVLMCEMTLAAGLVLIAYQTRPPTKVEVPSAFHPSKE